jgi:hypothetical protein
VNTASNAAVNFVSPVPDQELEAATSAAFEVHQQVAGLLSYPRPGWVGGDTGQVHAAGAVLDEVHTGGVGTTVST